MRDGLKMCLSLSEKVGHCCYQLKRQGATCVQFRWQLLMCVSAQDVSWIQVVLGSLLGKTALLALGCDGEAVLTLTAPHS